MPRLFQPGDALGGYRIVRLLGAGGFAEVYEAVNRAGVTRALKVLSAEISRGSKIRAGLAREAEALVRIEHVNVVRFYEAGIEEEHVYLVLEMVEGVTLGDKLGDPFALAPMEDAVRWIHQACEGVAEAHRVGVIHRDLKPANILVTPADVVKVIDFGIAKLRTWTSASNNEHLLGTALYMAPEQLQAQPADARADVYSMGVILYEALSGVHPLGLAGEAPTVFQVFQQHLVGEPRPLGEVAPEVPPALAAVVQQALAKDPRRRVPSMRALADALAVVLDQMARERRVAVRRIASLGRDPLDSTGPISSVDAPLLRWGPASRSSNPGPRSSNPGPRSSRSSNLGLRSSYPDPRSSYPDPRSSYPDSSSPGLRSSYPAPLSVPPELLGDDPSPLATTAAHEPDRSALPPPAPVEGVTSSRPPPAVRVSDVPGVPGALAATSSSDAVAEGAAGEAPAPPDPQPPRPSLPRGSSAVPVVAEAGDAAPRVVSIRRSTLAFVAAILAVLALAALWLTRSPGGVSSPTGGAASPAPLPTEAALEAPTPEAPTLDATHPHDAGDRGARDGGRADPASAPAIRRP